MEKKTVVLIEEDPMWQQISTALFEQLQIVYVICGRENYVQIMEDFLPDLILTDIFLDYQDSRDSGILGALEILRKIKSIEKLKDIPVVFLSVDSYERRKQEAYDLGITAYMPKPLTAHALLLLLSS